MLLAMAVILLGAAGYGVLLRASGSFAALGMRKLWYPAEAVGLGLCLAALAYAREQSVIYYCAFAGVCLLCAALPATGFFLAGKSASTDIKLHPMLQLGVGTVSGLVSFCISYLLVTELWMGVDFVWITLRLVLPISVLVAVLDTLEGFSPKYVLIGAAVQYILLVVFAEPLFAFLFHGDLHRGFFGSRWLEYLGAAFPYPALVTLGQFVLLSVRKSTKQK